MSMIHPGQRLELIFWAVMPALLTIFLTIAFLIPKHIAGLSYVMPLLPLMPVFYWGMMHAREMPYWFVFMLGLLMDPAQGTPLGLSSLLYMAFLALLHAQRRYIYKEGFMIKWGYFSMLLGIVGVLGWLLLSFFHSQAQPIQPALVQWVITSACYPVLHRGFDSIYEFVSQRRWRILRG